MRERKIQCLDVVAILHDRRVQGLLAGHIGTVIELLEANTYEVEFLDETGETVAVEELQGEDLILLRAKAPGTFPGSSG